MVIRRAEEQDIPGLLALLEQVGQVHHQIRPDIFRDGAQKYDHNALAELLAQPDKPIFVAVEADFVVGYCFCVLRSYAAHPIFNDRSELYIDDLCVDEKSRGSGIANALYDHVQSYGRASGCDVITLNVWCGNQRAQKFYEKMGMTPRNITMELPLKD